MRIIRGEDDILEGLAALRSIDARLDAVIAAAGPVPLRLAVPGFAGLAEIIVAQMVSKASAAAIWRRIAAAAGGPVTAQSYLAIAPAEAALLGLSGAKADTLARLATALDDGTFDLAPLTQLAGGEAIARLTAIKGIGLWTAEVYLMFCGGHVDIFPSGDVALRSAVGRALQLDPRPGDRQTREIASVWAPWRSVAARLFWAYYAASMGRDGVPLSGVVGNTNSA